MVAVTFSVNDDKLSPLEVRNGTSLQFISTFVEIRGEKPLRATDDARSQLLTRFQPERSSKAIDGMGQFKKVKLQFATVWPLLIKKKHGVEGISFTQCG